VLTDAEKKLTNEAIDDLMTRLGKGKVMPDEGDPIYTEVACAHGITRYLIFLELNRRDDVLEENDEAWYEKMHRQEMARCDVTVDGQPYHSYCRVREGLLWVRILQNPKTGKYLAIQSDGQRHEYTNVRVAIKNAELFCGVG
jgi:hypothetical protein